MATPKPAVLGGTPVVDVLNQPEWPYSGPIESAALAEITDSGQWVGFGHIPAKWRAILEQVVADGTGYPYAVGQPNGTLGIAAGFRAQLHTRDPAWATGRSEVLVPTLTHASANQGVLHGIATKLGRAPDLVPVDCRRDGTMDADVVAAYLHANADRVLGVMPATMYGNFGALDRICALADQYDVMVHHDNALGGAARYDGAKAPTASLSAQGEGKATPSCEGGALTCADAETAAIARADSDCGLWPTRYDPIPHRDADPLAAGNQRMGEQPAALMLVQWLRALHDRLIVRENRRIITEAVSAGDDVSPTPWLWVPPTDAEYPPFFCLFMECLDSMEEEVGISPEDLRVALIAEGIWAEAGYAPTHMDPAWAPVVADRGLSYDGAQRVHERAVFVHNKYMRHPDFADWMREILLRVRRHAHEVRGAAERAGERRKYTNPINRRHRAHT
jgi:dTDP-4-amino-4,6-dideoxygalactose transaminase